MSVDTKMTAIADAIRTKTGGTELLSLDGMAEAIEGIQAGGGGGDAQALLDAVIEGTATEVTTNATKICNYAFYHNKTITNINMPNVTSLGYNAFSGCSELVLTSLPEGLTSIGTYGFQGCSKLALTSLPEGLTSIENNVFSDCSKLALTSLPEGLTSIGNYGFQRCTELVLTSLPEGLTSIGSYAFAYCFGLTNITFKGKPSTIDSSAFQSCSNLLTINVPWAEGSGPSGSPWGAVNATINYNYTGE